MSCSTTTKSSSEWNSASATHDGALDAASRVPLEQICDYIQKDSSEAALATARRVYRRIEALGRYPYRGRAGRVSGTRELVLSPFPTLASMRSPETRS